MSEPVERIREGEVLRIRLNRAERRNVLSREMCSGLLDALLAAEVDENARALVLEASGPVFCGGQDADEPVTADDLVAQDRLLNISDELTKPLIAAVQGPALGSGVALIANATIVVAAQGATFAMSDIRTGRFPFIAYGPLARTVGGSRATELCLSGRVFTVPEAMAWGLVHHAAPVFEFDDRALSIANQVAQASFAAAAGLRFVAGREPCRSDARKRALEYAMAAMTGGS